MAYELVRNLTAVNFNIGKREKRYITVHYTGNKTDTAANNAKHFKNINRNASAHYFVDKAQVVQVVEDKNDSWAVGKNYGKNNLFGTVNNSNSIAVEMCSDNGVIAQETYNNTVALIKQLMKTHNIPEANVYRHYDICSKICPGWYGWTGGNQSIWNCFKNDIANGSVSNVETPQPTPPITPKSSGVIDIDYAVMIEGGKMLPVVRNLTDFAGISGKKIVGFLCEPSQGTIKYRVHLVGKGWLSWVTGFDWNDFNNGYAGDGRTPIDAIEVYLYSPNEDKYVMYRVSPVNSGYFSYQRDNEKGSNMDGYAGAFGKPIDRIQMYVL